MLRLPLPLLGLAMIAIVAAAAHTPQGRCDSDGQPALGIVEITLGYAAGSFYVDDRNWVFGNGLWMYQESNGIWSPKDAGVYDGDVVAHDLQRGTTCGPAGPILPLPGIARDPPSHCIVPEEQEICWDGAWEHDNLLW